MEPIKVNLASFEYFDKRLVYLMIISAVIIVLIISKYNYHLYDSSQREILNYEKKIAQLEKKLKEKQQLQNKNNIEIYEEEMKVLKNNADFVNRLIASDIFPWNQLLDKLEMKVPNGLVLNRIVPDGNYSKLTLAGFAGSTRKITFFMKRLEEWNLIRESVLLKLDLERKDSRLDIRGEDPKIEFEIENTLRIDRLFSDTGLPRIGNIFIQSS